MLLLKLKEGFFPNPALFSTLSLDNLQNNYYKWLQVLTLFTVFAE